MTSDLETALENIKNIKYSANYLPVTIFPDHWHQWRLSWEVIINGETFDYRAGLAHISDPKIRAYAQKAKRTLHEDKILRTWLSGRKQAAPPLADVLDCILSDARVGDMTLEDFEYEFDYKKASECIAAWNGCRENGAKIRRALGIDCFARLVSLEH